jgi:hypothetical protein
MAMNDKKRARIEQAQLDAAERKQKAIISLAHCLGRSDVYRLHHDSLVYEQFDNEEEEFTTVRKLRFVAYTCAWFSGLAAVIERFEELVNKGTIPKSDELAELITPDYVDLLKPFRNAIAHCSDHDDERILRLLDTPETTTDRAAELADAFKRYFKANSTRPIYE